MWCPALQNRRVHPRHQLPGAQGAPYGLVSATLELARYANLKTALAARGVIVSHEAVRLWCLKFGSAFAKKLRHRRGRPGDTWHLDELFIRIRGERYYLWRVVDQDGQTLDILVQKRRSTSAAKRFFRKLLKGLRYVPNRLVTDKLRSYAAAHRTTLPSVQHCTNQYANNRAEVSHQPTRQSERHMRRFKSARQVQQFLSVHSPINNLFRVSRHLIKAAHYRLFWKQAFTTWREATTELAAA